MTYFHPFFRTIHGVHRLKSSGELKKEELELIIYKEESEIRCKNSGFMATDGQGDTWSISTSKFLVANEDNICISGR